VIAPLGAGGMGEVYRARDERLGRDVAIKMLPAQFAAEPDRVRRFEREARVVAGLSHPHICQIYDVGPRYLVLEYIEGAPPSGPLKPEEAARIALQIVGALEAAHERQILHRDLKPANILVTPKGAVKLLDFGLAKAMATDEEMTRTVAGEVFGTLPYMSPEQAQGGPLDARSDIFSFGVVLYELLAGELPFDGPSRADVLTAILRDEPRALHAPAALENLVRRCLAKDPSRRFQSTTEIRAALEQFVRKPAVASGPSVAVLPFADMSAARDHEWFSDGLSEEIINALTQVPGLKVIARTSAFAFKGQQLDVRQIAERLGVNHVLEGSIRKAGDRVRITAQLISAADGAHVWSERFDRQLADVFAIQDEIAEAIAGTLRISLSPGTGPAPRHTPPIEAYEAFLMAQYHLQHWTQESLARSKESLERAIAIDPSFAQAHGQLGLTYMSLVTENQVLPERAAELMRASARRALEIEPSRPEAHIVLALVSVLGYDWGEAEREFRIAVAHDPPPVVRYFYAVWCLAPTGRMQEAEEQIERALQDDPLNVLFQFTQGMFWAGSNRIAQGEAKLRRVLEMDGFWLAHAWLSTIAVMRGSMDEALEHAQRAFDAVPVNYMNIGELAGVLRRLGDNERADALLEKLGDGSAFGAAAGLSYYYMTLSDVDNAAAWFEKAVVQRDTRAPWILSRQYAGALLSSRHWPRLAKLMNLPATGERTPSGTTTRIRG
jgi:TolB-like protein/tetratricopeptide (TPR) repeat protein/predicted Ser/Thr protein kinase